MIIQILTGKSNVFFKKKLQYPTEDATSFHALGRVFSGTLRAGQRARLLGEGYTMYDEEDSRYILWRNFVWETLA